MTALPTALPHTSETAARRRETAVRARVAELEDLFGDPSDPANPAGYTALLEADRAAVPFAAGRRSSTSSGSSTSTCRVCWAAGSTRWTPWSGSCGR